LCEIVEAFVALEFRILYMGRHLESYKPEDTKNKLVISLALHAPATFKWVTATYMLLE
jgi:hypothetical protein